MQKEKFYTPKVNIKESRKLYALASEEYNAQYFDENGKFKNKGSKKLNPIHQEIFISICLLMNDRLKRRNLSIKKNSIPVMHNFVRNPFVFNISTADVLNMMTQNQVRKHSYSRESVRRGMMRIFKDASFITMKWRRELHKYNVTINPNLVALQEISTCSLNNCKSIDNKSKKTVSSYYTIYNTNIINKKTNYSNFNEGKNLQANFKLNKKPKQKTLEQVKSETDNRKISIKREEYKKISEEIKKNIFECDKKSSAGEISAKIANTLTFPKKTRRFDKDKINKITSDFITFKKNTIQNFYILMLTLLWDTKKVELYSPINLKSPLYIYTLQSLQELETNEKYFGDCLTIEDFKYKKKLLTDALLRMKKNWVNTRASFNTEYLAPNRFINGTYPNFKLYKAIDFHLMRLEKEKHNKTIKTSRKYNEISFISALKFITNAIENKKQITKNKEFIKYIEIKYNKNEKRYICYAINKNNETFSYMQRLISSIKNSYKLAQ